MTSEMVRGLARTLLTPSIRERLREYRRRGAVFYRRASRRAFGKQMRFRNREGLRNFDFTLRESRERDGVSALLRAKNEANKIYPCLASIIDVFDEIVVVDNNSQDGTLRLVRQFKQDRDPHNKITVYLYPFEVARLGPEHGGVPEDSVHSFVYSSNWSLSWCSFRYVCKWDADMVLRAPVRSAFETLLRRTQASDVCWALPGQTVYRDRAGFYYLAKGEVNQEIRIFPYGFNPRFYKLDFCEYLRAHPPLPVDAFREVAFYELKFVDENEFAHWSTTEFPTPRKKREWEHYQMVARGEVDPARFEPLSPNFLEAGRLLIQPEIFHADPSTGE